MSVPTIAERSDIHKSCKSIEVIVNVLNDYCEAATALVTIQKKLAKALREAASAKVTIDVAENTLNTTAIIFETLYDVDTKFAKYVDKECDSVSTEVKKWFKKLAKDEKAHDAKIANANAKIKQAGLQYERKVKRSPQDAQEEHQRYNALLGTLGPEVSREKQNHGLTVTSRHTAVLCSLAGCLGRIADGEWLRACEGVRRFGPTVGQLGHWRTLCEGGWTGPLPPDLPAADRYERLSHPQNLSQPNLALRPPPPMSERSNQESSLPSPAPEYGSRGPTPTGDPVELANYSTPDSANTPQGNQQQASERSQLAGGEGRAFETLSSFPSPPAHFPLPPLSTRSQESPTAERRPELGVDTPDTTPLPVQAAVQDTRQNDTSDNSGSQSLRAVPEPVVQMAPVVMPPSTSPEDSMGTRSEQPRLPFPEPELPNPHLSSNEASVPRGNPSSSSGGGPSTTNSSQAGTSRGDLLGDSEFGRKALNVDLGVVERSDTGKTSGSIVAAMRDKYIRVTQPSSPPPKDVPKLPQSVSNIANRFETSSSNSPSSPGSVPKTSTEDRRRMSIEHSSRSLASPTRDNGNYHLPSAYSPQQPPPHPDDYYLRLQQQRLKEDQEMELREHELHLLLKEKEIEQKAIELERDRVRLMNARTLQAKGSRDYFDGSESSSRYPLPIRARADSTSAQSRQQSYNGAHLVPPSQQAHSGASSPRVVYTHQLSSSPGSSPMASRTSISEHPAYCTCDSCLRQRQPVKRVPVPAQSAVPTPAVTLRSEKPKGWIRRLSMPVMGNTFLSDSKKANNNTFSSVANSPVGGYRNSMAFVEEDGRLMGGYGVVGGTKNRSTTNVNRR